MRPCRAWLRGPRHGSGRARRRRPGRSCRRGGAGVRRGLPGAGEPADLGQFGGAEFGGEPAEPASGFDGPELGGIADGQDPGRACGLLDQCEVGGADLAGLVDDELVGGADVDGMPEPVGVAAFAEEPGDVVGLGQAFGGHDPGGVFAEGQADQPAAGQGVPYRGGRGDGPGLACPGGGGQQGHGPVRGEQADDRLVLLAVQVLVVPAELGPDLLLGDQRPDRAPGLADHLFFEVEVAEGSPAQRVRLAQDGLPVGFADAEGADVHQVRCRADLDDLGADGAGDGQHGHLGDVGRGGADGQGPVDFQAQVRDPPCASLSLRFCDGDPCGPGLVRGGQLEGPRRACGVGLGLGVDGAEDLELVGGGLLFPGLEPFLVGHLMAGDLAAGHPLGLGLGPPGVLGDLLAHQVDRAPARRLAVPGRVLVHPCAEPAVDGPGPGGEPVHDLLGDAADFGAVPVGAPGHGVAHVQQPLLEGPVDGDPVQVAELVEMLPVSSAPYVVGAVGALDGVEDGQVDVQLRVPVPADRVQPRSRYETFAVPPFPRGRRVVPGPHIAGHGLEQLEALADRVEQRVLDGLRFPVQGRGLDVIACFAGLACGHAQASVQHRDRLRRAAGHVVVGPGDARADGPDPGPLGVDLAGGRERVLLPVPGYREGLGRGLVLAGLRGGMPDDPLPAGAHAVLVEPLGDLGRHRP